MNVNQAPPFSEKAPRVFLVGAKDILNGEVVGALAKLGGKASPLPIDPAAAISAIGGLFDGDVSDKDLENVGAVVGGTAVAGVASAFGIPSQLSRPIGEFIGKHVIGNIAKGFKFLFGRKARKRAEHKRKMARLRAEVSAAGRGLAVASLDLRATTIAYDLADEAKRLKLFPGGLSRSVALSKIFRWQKELGWVSLWKRYPEWQKKATVAGKDPKLAEKLEANEALLDKITAEIFGILTTLHVAVEGAKEAKRRHPPQLRRASTGPGGWQAPYAEWTDRIAAQRGWPRQQAQKWLAAQVTPYKTGKKMTLGALQAWEKDFVRALEAMQAAAAAPPKLAPAPKGRTVPKDLSPTAVVRRPQLRGIPSRFRNLSRPSTAATAARGFAVRPSRTMTHQTPLLAAAMGRRLKWRPLTRPAAALVARFAPGVRAEILTGGDTQGIEEGGKAYRVESGDSPWKIAERLTGSGGKWKDLIRANPSKSTGSDGNFKYLNTGERLNVPESWRANAADEIERRSAAVRDTLEEAVIAEQPSLSPIERMRGLAADLRSYVVQDGDSPWKIATMLVGSGQRWKDLIRANPIKQTVANGNFKFLSTGERLNLPPAWTQILAAAAPLLEEPMLQADPVAPRALPPPTVVTSPGQPIGGPPRTGGLVPGPTELRDDADAVVQAKAILVTWSRTDGADVPAGVVGYGTSVADASPIWGARDRLQLQTFALWVNVSQGTRLDTEADLTQAHLDALRAWAESRAGEPGAVEYSDEDLRVIERVPETVISGGDKKKGSGAALLLGGLAALAASQL